MKIGIVARSDLKEALDLTKKIRGHLSSEEVILAPGLANAFDEGGVPVEDMDVESIVSMGGDGTLLYTLQQSPEIPILGINMGGRGFLADVDPGEALKAVDKLREGELELVERERVAVEISGEPLAHALNEGVIRSKEPSRILCFRVLINGEEVEENRGDGLIVSTPTGSTAYAMASGGPVIDPNVKAFVAVPLSVHRPRTIPLVFPMSSRLEVELLESDKKADVTVDGQVTEVAGQGDIVSFRRSENKAKFYRWRGGFYGKMKEKL